MSDNWKEYQPDFSVLNKWPVRAWKWPRPVVFVPYDLEQYLDTGTQAQWYRTVPVIETNLRGEALGHRIVFENAHTHALVHTRQPVALAFGQHDAHGGVGIRGIGYAIGRQTQRQQVGKGRLVRLYGHVHRR